MKLSLGYGKQSIMVNIAKENIIEVLEPKKFLNDKDEESQIKDALNNPIGTKKLREIVKQGEKVVIITSDITRPLPSKKILPAVLEELRRGGIRDEDIKIVFALGSHRGHSDEEKKEIVGDYIYSRYSCIDSKTDNCIRLGRTSRGTPVDIFRDVVEADRRICLGNIEYHYFAGYSGGAKAIMPGVSNREAIQANHRMMLEEASKTGNIIDNPVREDIEEAINHISIDFLLNVVLDEQKTIIKAFSGHWIEAHRAGCDFLDSIYKIEVDRLADVVIVSPGGYPKDINMYQAQKALDNASNAVRKDGIIIWVASCSEGFGESVFKNWIDEATIPEELLERVRSKFELGGHKAAAIAKVLKKCEVCLVSDLDNNSVTKAFLKPFESVDNALEYSFKKLGSKAQIIVMPYGGSTLPVKLNIKNDEVKV